LYDRAHMKAQKLITLSIAGLLLFAVCGNAQDLLSVTFHATCFTTNDAGDALTKIIDNRSILKQVADDNSITNKKDLVLVYHVAGDMNGDTIEAIDRSTGALVQQKYRLLFPMVIPSADGVNGSQFTGVFPDQQPDSVGTAVISQHTTFDRNGNMRKSVYQGSINYYVLPNGTNGLIFCTGTFTTGKAVTTPAQ
jgi:hypothetical protein